MTIELTNDEHATALREGWILSEGQYGTIIERDDDQKTFAIDDEAIEHVTRQAFGPGAAMYAKALAIHHESWADYWRDHVKS